MLGEARRGKTPLGIVLAMALAEHTEHKTETAIFDDAVPTAMSSDTLKKFLDFDNAVPATRSTEPLADFLEDAARAKARWSGAAFSAQQVRVFMNNS